MLELADLDVHYAKNHVLKGVTMRVGAGEVVALVGANAAGKTTTLRTVMGLKAATRGTVTFQGARLDAVPTHERVGRGLVLVPEGRQVFPRFTVVENLLMGGYQRPDRNRLERDFDAMFAMFPRLAERKTQRPARCRAASSRCWRSRAASSRSRKCLLLDEPTLGLAPIIVEEISRTIRTLAEGGMTILIAEQNAAMALAIADRAYVLETGRVALEGSGAELAGDAAVQRNYLGG